jgi:tetratricopeptide (TPR) repeat protein
LASYYFHWAHDYDHDEVTRMKALSLAKEHGSDVGRGFAIMLEGFFASTQRGDIDAFDRATAEGMRIASGHPAVRGAAGQFRGMLAEWVGDYNEAIPLLQGALADFRSIKRTDFMAQCAWFIGISAACLGRYGDALSLLGESLMIVERIGLRSTQARLLNTMGWCYGEMGAHERSKQLNSRSVEIAGTLVELNLVAGADELYANAGVNLAGNLIALGDYDGAEQLIDPIRRELAVPGDPWQRWRYSLHVDDVIARIALGRGDPEKALVHTALQLSVSRKCRARKIEGRALICAAQAHLSMDQRDEARQTLDQALEIGRALGHPPIVWRTLFLLAELERRQGDTSAAANAEADARGLIQTLAKPLGDPKLAAEFSALADRLSSDPMRNG